MPKSKRDPIGYQVVDSNKRNHDNPPNCQNSYTVYTLETCLDFIRYEQGQGRHSWRLLPVFEGDIEDVEYEVEGNNG